MDFQSEYISRINKILSMVDFERLDRSCNSAENNYAKCILQQLHNSFVDVYGTTFVSSRDNDFIELPAVIRGKNTGHTALGIITIDLESSGEHWGTWFLTPKGVLEQGAELQTDQARTYINEKFIPYGYWYTVDVENDIHVDFDSMPERVADLVNSCWQNSPELSEDDSGMKME